MKMFDIVAAVDLKLGIGKNGKLPWKLAGDMQHFRDITTATVVSGKRNAVIMGRRTWESLPEKFRPLPQRLNVVLTRSRDFPLPPDVLRASDFSAALALLETGERKDSIENIFVIGGSKVFAEALSNSRCRSIYLTQVLSTFECDVFFPDFRAEFAETLSSGQIEENSLRYYFAVYSRVPDQK